MRISDWSSDVCSSDLGEGPRQGRDDMRGKRLALAMMMACAGSAAIAAPLHAQAAPAETLEIDKKRIDAALAADRKSVGWGKSVSVRVDLGGRRIIKKKK